MKRQNEIDLSLIQYSMPIKNFPSISSRNGYHVFSLFVIGDIEADTSLSISSSSIKQLTAVPISIDRVYTSDRRLITGDSQIRSSLQFFLDSYVEHHSSGALHIASPG